MASTTARVWVGPPALENLLVPVGDLTAHPANPRRGELPAIVDSLDVNGQYRPIVVAADGVILAGNHTWKAAKAHGWTHVAAVRVPVASDSVEARRILVADNRAGDLGSFNNGALADVLADLSDFAGSGFEERDYRRLASTLESSDLFGDAVDNTTDGHARLLRSDVAGVIQIGLCVILVEPDHFTEWLDTGVDKDDIPARLDLPIVAPADDAATATPGPGPGGDVVSILDQPGVEDVPIGLLTPVHERLRRHNLDAIAESLRVNGQYRPVVITDDGSVLVGWGVVQAAKQLGWSTVAAVRSGVTSADDARRIALVDNRTAELAWYDEDALAGLLGTFDDPTIGTGFSAKAVDDLLSEVSGAPAAGGEKPRTLRVEYGPARVRWVWQTTATVFRDWQEPLLRQAGYSADAEMAAYASLLGLDPARCHDTGALGRLREEHRARLKATSDQTETTGDDVDDEAPEPAPAPDQEGDS